MRLSVPAVVGVVLACVLTATASVLPAGGAPSGAAAPGSAAADVPAAPGLAAVPVADLPLPGWSPWAACPGTSGGNCADVRAVAAAAGGATVVGGTFSHLVAPDGVTRVPRRNIAALTASGQPADRWAAEPNGAVLGLATDGPTVYLGGAFTTLGAAAARHVARVDVASGRRLPFTAATDGPVSALALSGGRLYAGGRFSAAGAQVPRAALAAFDAATGSLDAAWAPRAELIAGDAFPNDRQHNLVPVRSIAVDEARGRVYVAGDFDLLGGLPRAVVAVVDRVTGATDPTFTLPATVGRTLQGFDVVVADGEGGRPPGVVLAAGGVVNAAFRFDPNGALVWRVLTDGDVQAAAIVDDTVYLGGHFVRICLTDCRSPDPGAFVPRVHVAAFPYAGRSTPLPDPGWVPRLGPRSPPYYYGVWALEATAESLLVGGVFADVVVDDTRYRQAKLARFPIGGPA